MSWVAIASFWIFLLSGSDSHAAPTQCLSAQTTRTLTTDFRDLILHRQQTFETDKDRTPIRQALRILNSLESIRATDDELECLGFDIRFKQVDSLEHERVRGHLALTFFLLDESMYPPALNDSAPFARKTGNRITIVDEFKFMGGSVGGFYNWISNRISFKLSTFNTVWPLWYRTIELPTRRFATSLNEWVFWGCDYPSPLGSGSLPIALHEYGHNLDFGYRRLFGDPHFSSRTKSWKKLHATEFTSPYGATSAVEDFAESFVAYLLDPLMKCYAPGKYAWFSKFVRINEEIYDTPRPYESLSCSDPDFRELVQMRQATTQYVRACPKEHRNP